MCRYRLFDFNYKLVTAARHVSALSSNVADCIKRPQVSSTFGVLVSLSGFVQVENLVCPRTSQPNRRLNMVDSKAALATLRP
jgi:hypothetical protein